MNKSVFEEPMIEWDKMKIDLISYCKLYYDVHRAEERPSNDTIDDNVKLDEWLKLKRREFDDYQKKMKDMSKESNQRSGGSSRSQGSSFAFDMSMNEED